MARTSAGDHLFQVEVPRPASKRPASGYPGRDDGPELHVAGYRSIRELTLPLAQVNVVVGPNGVGKTNLYRTMVLLGSAASGSFARTLAEEGGCRRCSGPASAAKVRCG
ncbi:hypothetical protein WME75_01040 [Sorangium sp. So ce1014]|uniref:hypothetical protein n=1 Tax=Sorangium sp. So ce1014 TaxID=3133326 RepID=UPI003F6236BD